MHEQKHSKILIVLLNFVIFQTDANVLGQMEKLREWNPKHSILQKYIWLLFELDKSFAKILTTTAFQEIYDGVKHEDIPISGYSEDTISYQTKRILNLQYLRR